MNVDELVAIDVHTHAEISEDGHVSLSPELFGASEKYFKAEGHRKPGIAEMADYYRQRTMAAVVFTVDLIGGSNRETMRRQALTDSRDCSACHRMGRPAPGQSGSVDDRDNSRKPMLAALAPGTPEPEMGTPTWEFVRRLRDATTMQVFLKGIVTREDAELAMRYGVDGLFVSNHGGRAENSLRATITAGGATRFTTRSGWGMARTPSRPTQSGPKNCSGPGCTA